MASIPLPTVPSKAKKYSRVDTYALYTVVIGCTASVASAIFAAYCIYVDIEHFRESATAELEEFRNFSTSAYEEMRVVTGFQLTRHKRSGYGGYGASEGGYASYDSDPQYGPSSYDRRKTYGAPALSPKYLSEAVDESPETVSNPCNCHTATQDCDPGPRGPPGSRGEPGFDGLPGTPGSDGIHGAALTLNDGECIKCPPGPPGNPGHNGVSGRPGAQGQPGRAGVPGRNGQPGKQGQIGAIGQPGRNGADGRGGMPGVSGFRYVSRRGGPGPTGPIGPQGPRGEPGTKGAVGERGGVGTIGPSGKSGRNGTPGTRGAPGEPGKPGGDAIYCPCPRRTEFEAPSAAVEHVTQGYGDQVHVSATTAQVESYRRRFQTFVQRWRNRRRHLRLRAAAKA